MEESLVRRLAAFRGAPVVTSLYLDVDGRRYPRPTDYVPHLEALLDEARRRARGAGAACAAAVEADLARIRLWFADGVDRRRARGVAAFCCSGEGFFEVVTLTVGVRDEVVLTDAPAVAHLCEVLAGSEAVLVALVDRHRSRMLRLEGGVTEEEPGPLDVPAQAVDTDVELGSWERQHEEQARHHFRRVAGEMTRELERHPVRRIVLGGPPEAVAAVEAYLPRRVRSHVVGHAHVAMHDELDEVATVAWDLVHARRRQEEHELAEAVRSMAEEGHGAVSGLAATLGALGDGIVTTLVVGTGLRGAGGRCRSCDRLLPTAEQCPACAGPGRAVEDVIEAAVGDALRHHVELEFCDSAALAALGGIGALVRS